MHPTSSESQNAPQIEAASSGIQKRNLVVCIDGTSNKFGPSYTNVVELYKRLAKDPNTQLTYYNSGVGTLATPSYISFAFVWRAVDHWVDLAIGWNFEKAILKAYRWLADNYRPGDRIFFFGFSRGAYQVRTLAAMIDDVGLLQPGNEEQIPFAYELYARNSVSRKLSVLYIGIAFGIMILWLFAPLVPLIIILVFFGWVILGQTILNLLARMISLLPVPTPKPEKNAQTDLPNHYKDTFSRKARVHFLGVWDTVSSLGHLRSKDLPKTVDGDDHICVFRHALALDERRVKFLPEYCYGGASPYGGGSSTASRTSIIPKVKETWFRGSHPDIGGKHNIGAPIMPIPNNPSLRWMAYEAARSGLIIDLEGLHNPPAEPETVRNTLKYFWRIMEYLPIEHRSYKYRDSVTLVPHCGKRRIPVRGQKVHASVSVRNRPPGMVVDTEANEAPISAREHCGYCD